MEFTINNVRSLHRSISNTLTSDEEEINLYYEDSPQNQDDEESHPQLTQLTQRPNPNPNPDPKVAENSPSNPCRQSQISNSSSSPITQTPPLVIDEDRISMENNVSASPILLKKLRVNLVPLPQQLETGENNENLSQQEIELSQNIIQLTQQNITNTGIESSPDEIDVGTEEQYYLMNEIGHITQNTQTETNPMREWNKGKFSIYACFRCDFQTNNHLTLRRHTVKHMQKDADCDTCKRWLNCDVLAVLKDWSKEKKPKETDNKCPLCKFKGKTAQGLGSHMRIHNR